MSRCGQTNSADVVVRMVDGPIDPARDASWSAPGAGALVCFQGVVRGQEGGRPVVGLDYEDYPPMSERELERLGREVARSHGLLGMRVWHSRGRVGVGECSFHLCVASAHRKEALAGMDEFIDRMKREVPLWKVAVFKR